MKYVGPSCFAAALAVATLAPAAVTAADGDVQIAFTCCSYAPGDVRVAPGGAVRWNGEFDGTPAHPLRSGTGEADESFSYNGPDQTFAHTYTHAGVFHYYCLIHGVNGGGMKGTVTVTANHVPSAVLAQPAATTTGTTITLDASGSSDADAGQTLAYAWDLDGDGSYEKSTGATPTVTTSFGKAGNATVGVKVTDSNSDAVGPESTTATRTVTVTAPGGGGPAPTPTATPAPGQPGQPGGPAATATPTPAPGATATPKLTLTLGSKLTLLRLRAKNASITVKSTRAGKVSAKLTTGATTLASGSVTVLAGRSKPLKLTLSAAGKRKLATAKTLKVTLRVSGLGAKAVSKVVTLKR